MRFESVFKNEVYIGQNLIPCAVWIVFSAAEVATDFIYGVNMQKNERPVVDLASVAGLWRYQYYKSKGLRLNCRTTPKHSGEIPLGKVFQNAALLPTVHSLISM